MPLRLQGCRTSIKPWYDPHECALREEERRLLLQDTHAHLDAHAFAREHDAIIERAHAAGVDRILTVGSDLASSEAAVELAHRYDMVYAAVGVHPHEARRFEAESDAVQGLLNEDKVVAVGEIGLDFSRDMVPRDVQRTAFREQLGWARRLGLPASVHNRDADADVLQMLASAGIRAVLHCFSSGSTTAKAALDGGHFLSFAGIITFPRSENLRTVAQEVLTDRILVETDCPGLSPQPWRGRRNEPAYVTAVVEMVAKLHGVSAESMGVALARNADRVFAWRQT